MNPSLANRLAAYACHDLVKSCPLTTGAAVHWLHQAGFWLAELAAQPPTAFDMLKLISDMALPYSLTMGMPLADAAQVLTEHMKLHQLTRQS